MLDRHEITRLYDRHAPRRAAPPQRFIASSRSPTLRDHDVPILTELRADLDAAFARAEAARHRRGRRRWLLPAGGATLAAGAARTPAPVPRDDRSTT
jgi:hypothetical protein